MVHEFTDGEARKRSTPVKAARRLPFFSRALSERNLAPGRHVGPMAAGRQHGVALPADLGTPVAAQTGASPIRHQPAIPAPEEALQDALAAASGLQSGIRAGIRPFLKRSIDIAGSAAGLILLSPLLAGLAIGVKLSSPGPVIFRQARYGRNNELFMALKFRSMYVAKQDATGVAQTRKNDPRITPIGRFLRKSNFDELPQLWNVLKGEMSLVGPRPHVPGMLAAGKLYEEFDTRYLTRHQVRPGITGLAQVNGFRGETTDPYHASMRLEYDLEYLKSQTTRGDLKIIVMTVVNEFTRGSGY
ncbi:Putative colanic biosynthesis UDP-glucose lipid carrier transferase [Pannonibacter phragmitetus]|uniref:Colanic biosynthesis UDP-glucose lipid carrier transferase n=1 Tax=Pannonibacter phragmitetus TaxID=121719 RepID=A0A378ZUH2_9HYPH|nr:sugar transferase [Pannonibacter phragmitetus]SUB00181.1 Putative colanic biosynthesis UDP-glucose lipid carrier transferase [Pannonibacter phragmitetus]